LSSGSRATEVAGRSTVSSCVLLLIVGIECPAELLLGVAHSIGAIVGG
jgi:hypothetical protein